MLLVSAKTLPRSTISLDIDFRQKGRDMSSVNVSVSGPASPTRRAIGAGAGNQPRRQGPLALAAWNALREMGGHRSLSQR